MMQILSYIFVGLAVALFASIVVLGDEHPLVQGFKKRWYYGFMEDTELIERHAQALDWLDSDLSYMYEGRKKVRRELDLYIIPEMRRRQILTGGEE